MEINPQFFALQELSIRDSRLLDRLEGSQERLEKLDELMAKIDASVEKYGAAPQRLLDQMDAVIAKVASITDRIEARASDALASDIAQIRILIDANRDLVDAAEAALPGGAALDRDAFKEVKKAVKQLDRMEDSGLDRIETIVERIEESPSERLYKTFDKQIAKLVEKADEIDATLNGQFDSRLDALRDQIEQKVQQIEDIRNPPAQPEPDPELPPEPAPEPDATPEPEPAPEPDPAPVWSVDDFRGEGETVVVIDTGWNTQFIGPDEDIVFEYDFYGADDASARVADSNDHGSWVDQVVRGVASLADVIHMKVFPDGDGSAGFFDIAQALSWVADNVSNYNITAVNLSLGAGNVQDYVSNHYFGSQYQSLADQGVLSIVAAGNSGQYGMNYVAADPNAIAVSASTSSDTRAGFSQHHENLTDIFAFGYRVGIEDETGGVDTVSGTSFSAPYVSGVAARVQEAAEEIIDRHLTQDEFVYVLQESGRELVGYDGNADGYKVADADRAVECFIDNYADFV
ncbi:MAG: S8 family serine peptidase [Marinovum sp.]|nr:S8 family serine peptidase [Marinovum sp.]